MGNTETAHTLTIRHSTLDLFGDVDASEEYPSYNAALADLEDYEKTYRVGFDYDADRDDDGRTGNLYRNGECVGYWSILRTA